MSNEFVALTNLCETRPSSWYDSCYICDLFNTGPQPDWDPDIVAALDEDFNFDDPENQLDDDFMLQANADGGLTQQEGSVLHVIRFSESYQRP